MSEFKDVSINEKITHLLAGELSSEEKIALELLLEADSTLNKEFKNTKDLLTLLSADKKTLSTDGGIGEERKSKIFGNSKIKNEIKISVFKQYKFSFLAAAIVLFSTIYFSGIWQVSPVNNPGIKIHESQVAGVTSFNMAMPSGTYYFTLKDGALNLKNIDVLDGADFLKEAGVKAGDQILMVNGIETKSFKKEDWRNLLTSNLNSKSVYLQIKRDGQILPSHIEK